MTLLAALVAVSGVVVLPAEASPLELAPALRVVHERPLDEWPDAARIFRFVWIPAFPSMRMISVRVQEEGGVRSLVARAAEWRYDRQIVAVPEKIDTEVDRILTTVEWESLAAMREAGFWRFRPRAYSPTQLDGATWVLEGIAGGERLRVVQQAPDASAFTALCRRMVSAFGLKLRESEAPLRD